MTALMCSKARCYSSSHTYLKFFFVRRVRGSAIAEKSVRNFRYHDAVPKNRYSCLRFLCSGCCTTGAILSGSGLKPSHLTKTPRYLTSDLPNKLFSVLRVRPASLILVNTRSKIIKCSSIVSITMIMSSRYKNVYGSNPRYFF